MQGPIDYSRLERALQTPQGFIELAVLGLCLVLAWLVDRRIWSAKAATEIAPRITAGVARVAFPLTALVATLFATFVYRRYVGPPFFLAIAVPLLIALALIRMFVFGMRRMFHVTGWVATTERAITFVIWGGVILYFLGLLPEIAQALDDVVIPIGKTRVSLLTIGSALLVVVATLIVTLWISGMIEQRLASATQIDVNFRVVLSKFVRAALLLVGILIALQAIGFDLTLLSVFGGALGVGIGLGLQKLASNYIAGFTILLDRSIRMGDMVTIDGRHGVVSKVTSRYVVVRGLDGVEAIVPNETLVTTTVLNHSYSTRDIRIAVPIQVAYDADVERALALMEETARAQPRVLKAPNPPLAFLTGFGDNGINLELGFWINDPENGQGNLRSTINRALLAAFNRNDIPIPFPQREVRIVGLDGTPLAAMAAAPGNEATAAPDPGATGASAAGSTA